MLSLNPTEPPKQKLLWNFEILVQLSLKWGPSAQAFHIWNSMITTATTSSSHGYWVVLLVHWGGRICVLRGLWSSIIMAGETAWAVWVCVNWINMRNDKSHLSCVSPFSYIGICRWAPTSLLLSLIQVAKDAIMQSEISTRGAMTHKIQMWCDTIWSLLDTFLIQKI